jgi:1,4-alpha-glucan branching enzyme
MGRKKKSTVLENETKEIKKIDFELFAPEAQNVSLAGDFNDWDMSSHPLGKNSDGTWKVKIDLMPGKYEYRFLVDGEWMNDPNCTSFVPNPFGGENCTCNVLDVVIT